MSDDLKRRLADCEDACNVWRRELDEAKRTAVYWKDNAEAFHKRLVAAEKEIERLDEIILNANKERVKWTYEGDTEGVREVQQNILDEARARDAMREMSIQVTAANAAKGIK